MADDQKFIDAILYEPENVSLRSVYADWLEERGDPRADFLRLHLDNPKSPKLRTLAKRIDPIWLGLMNACLRPGAVVAIIGGDLEGMEATIREVDLRRGIARVWPHIFCRPYALPEVSLTQLYSIGSRYGRKKR